LPPLLRHAWYGLNQGFRQRIAHLDLTPDQFTVLRWLSEGDPKGLTQRDLTELMASDPNTIAATLKRMEAAGFIKRSTHETDRRAYRVTPLPKGRRLFDQAKPIAIAWQTEVLSAIPANRRDQFLADLESIGARCFNSLSAVGKTSPQKAELPPPI
jgi:DNA-binding MarR family transcriptional regulator